MSTSSEIPDSGPLAGLREVVSMSVPIVLGAFSFMVMQFVDVYFVSRLGPNNLAAIGSAGIWSYTLSTLFLGVVSCVSTFAAQSLGRNEKKNCSRFAWQGIYFSLGAGAVAAAMWPVAESLFALMQHTPEVTELEVIYFRIRLLGFIFVAWQASVASFFQAIGKPIIPMYIAFAVNIVNGVLDYAMIFGHFGFPAWGIGGAAIATVISMGLQVFWLQAVFMSKPIDKEFSTRSTYRFDLTKLKDLVRIGWPSGLTIFLDVASWSIFTSFMVGRLGTTQLAAQTAALQFMHLTFIPALGLNHAITAITGKWIGRGEIEVAKARTYTTTKIAMVYMITVGALMAIFGEPLMHIFSSDAEVVSIGRLLLIMAAVFAGFDAINIVFTGALRGAGDTRWMMYATFIGAYFFNLPLAYLFSGPLGMGAVGAWLGATIYIIVLSGAIFRRFKGEAWRNIKIFSEDRQPEEEQGPRVQAPAEADLGSSQQA